MTDEKEKPFEVIQLPDPDIKSLTCPNCKSNKIIYNNSYSREIPDLGTKTVRKFVEFESIHYKCNSCSEIFYLERDGIIKGLSVTKNVLDTVLLLYFDFEEPGEKIAALMEKLYSIKILPEKVWYWVRKYGNEYCKKNVNKFKENLEDCSGYLAMDGTFPKLGLENNDNSSTKGNKKKVVVPLLRLTRLQDGTWCAIWEEVKKKKK